LKNPRSVAERAKFINARRMIIQLLIDRNGFIFLLDRKGMAHKVNGRTRMMREIYRSNLKPILKKQYNISEKVAVEAKLR